MDGETELLVAKKLITLDDLQYFYTNKILPIQPEITAITEAEINALFTN